MTKALALKWLTHTLLEEGIHLDKVHRDKLAGRLTSLVANETADALGDVANVIAGQASALRQSGGRT